MAARQHTHILYVPGSVFSMYVYNTLQYFLVFTFLLSESFIVVPAFGEWDAARKKNVVEIIWQGKFWLAVAVWSMRWRHFLLKILHSSWNSDGLYDSRMSSTVLSLSLNVELYNFSP